MAEENFRKANEYKITNTTRLLSEGSDVNAADYSGLTPLHAAAARDSVDVVRLLLERGADPDAPVANGSSPLKHVRRLGTPEMREVFAELL